MYVTTNLFLHGKTSQIFRVNGEERVYLPDAFLVEGLDNFQFIKVVSRNCIDSYYLRQLGERTENQNV